MKRLNFKALVLMRVGMYALPRLSNWYQIVIKTFRVQSRIIKLLYLKLRLTYRGKTLTSNHTKYKSPKLATGLLGWNKLMIFFYQILLKYVQLMLVEDMEAIVDFLQRGSFFYELS